MKRKIAIIDYGMGNLRSVQKALEHAGAQAEIITSVIGADNAAGLVLPGVGAFRQAIEQLRKDDFDKLVLDWIAADRPFLGICLGLQLLFEESEEFGVVAGLGLVPGRVVRFSGPQFEDTAERPGLKVPHMGWNQLKVVKPHPVLENLPQDAMAYFVHSYYCEPDDSEWTSVITEHGIEFTSAIARGNLFASQFHPEKSGDMGQLMLANFIKVVKSAC